MKRQFALCVLLALLPFPVQSESRDVHDLVIKRLHYMEAVAIWKWNAGVPVEDLEREAQVLKSAVDNAVELGLPSASISAFFGAQIAAAKAIQFCWIDRYRTGIAQPDADPPDLVKVVRPALLDLGARITEEIARNQSDPTLGDASSLTEAAGSLDCLDAWHLGELAESLAQVAGP